MHKAVHTTCAYCGVGCGIVATPMPDGSVDIKGDDTHPANYGRLCSKGSALGETLGLSGRLLHPMIDGQAVKWDQALDHVADAFSDLIEKHGPDSVAFYASGQFLTEDYYVANKLMKGFIGSANIDTNSRLCMSSTVTGHKRAFGEDLMPGCYEDIEEAELTVLVGANSAWCHPVLYQRTMAAKENDPAKRLIVIDPRGTMTSESADLHLAINPGSDAYLFNGLLSYLAQEGKLDDDYIREHVSGAENAISMAIKTTSNIAEVAAICGLSHSDLSTFYQWFATTEKTVTLYSQGINQSSSGSDKVNAIINAHLATGRIGKPGMGPFSLTGQPNAMGGREAGGLSNTLTAHMEIENERHRNIVSKYWGTSNLPASHGLTAVDIFRAVKNGDIKAIWIMATNPAVSMPEADVVQEALRNCDMVVVSDCVADTQTTRLANVLLPALTWGEKDGTVTNSERCISRQRAFLPPPGQAKADWWIISEVAKRMGYHDAFSYCGPDKIFNEYAALTACENNGDRLLNLSGLMDMNACAYDNLQPIQWPVFGKGTKRVMPDKKVHMVGISPILPSYGLSTEFPLTLNTGRTRDHWHTMTRTAKSPRLSSHTVEPYVEIHPIDAMASDLKEGGLAEVSSSLGKIIVRVVFSKKQQLGSVFVPIHWSDLFASHGRVGAIINARLDPDSKQPAFKQTAVKVVPYKPDWYAFVLSVDKITPEHSSYKVNVQGDGFFWLECAGEYDVVNWDGHAKNLLGARDNDEWVVYSDERRGIYRFSLIREGHLIACMFVANENCTVPRHWLSSLMNNPLNSEERLCLLSGMPSRGEDVGPTVCACFGVGSHKIVEAIKLNNLTTLQEVGDLLRAGTNCGSCVPELVNLLNSA